MSDPDRARRFVQLHGRLLDRRRLDHLVDGGPAAAVVTAVAAYASPDGGYAGVIEPDVRTLSSQPIAVLTAFEFLAEVGSPAPPAALDWLARLGPDGPVPFALPADDDAPAAPWMAPAPEPSLHMTSAIAAAALRAGASGGWLASALGWCRAAIAERELTAHETKYALGLLDAAGDVDALADLAARLPADGRLPVAGGVEGEALTLLELAPRPDSPVRARFDPALVEAALDELAAGQADDGGWSFDWLDWSPTTTWEWRARLTVDALATLRRHDRL